IHFFWIACVLFLLKEMVGSGEDKIVVVESDCHNGGLVTIVFIWICCIFLMLILDLIHVNNKLSYLENKKDI
ncbi:hypothetical protein ACJX0J_015810, partial [Zea mays]